MYRDLAEREAKIRRLVDANIIGVLISDLDGQILEANDAFLRDGGIRPRRPRCGAAALDGPDAAGVAGHEPAGRGPDQGDRRL